MLLSVLSLSLMVVGVVFLCVFLNYLLLMTHASPDVWRRSVSLFFFSVPSCLMMFWTGGGSVVVVIVGGGGSGKGKVRPQAPLRNRGQPRFLSLCQLSCCLVQSVWFFSFVSLVFACVLAIFCSFFTVVFIFSPLSQLLVFAFPPSVIVGVCETNCFSFLVKSLGRVDFVFGGIVVLDSTSGSDGWCLSLSYCWRWLDVPWQETFEGRAYFNNSIYSTIFFSVSFSSATFRCLSFLNILGV